MGLMCKVFGHRWRGCRCVRCRRGRDVDHDWRGCTCHLCGRTRDEEHVWNGCQCRVCGKVRHIGHDWDGCVCGRCGAWRNEGHQDKDGFCARCGEKISTHCEHCKTRLTAENRTRGTAAAVCSDCYRRARAVNGHRLVSYNTPTQYDMETQCLRCGAIFSSYDVGQSHGTDFEKTRCPR